VSLCPSVILIRGCIMFSQFPLLLAVYAVCVSSDVSFVSLGDWGGEALPASWMDFDTTVGDVADQLASTVEKSDAQFLVNTGDSFYWCGIQNTSDFQVQTDFIGPYSKHQVLGFKWYGVLGNHEYGYNVSAVLDLTNTLPNWILPERYYTKRVLVSDGVYISFIFIDSSPCVSEYRASSKAGWDPCGSQYPTCSLHSNKSDNFEGPCRFHENIMDQDCSKQLTWFKAALSNVPKDDWLIVVGHHPIDEMDVEDFTAALQSHGFDLYINGHAHTLTHYAVDGGSAYITTGAGAMVATHDQVPDTPAKLRTYNKVTGLAVEDNVHGHSYQAIWNQKIPGFTLHTFLNDFKQLRTDFITYKGNIPHSFVVTKGIAPSPPPTPGPNPSPAPPPSGPCCYYDEDSCTLGATCCTTKSKPYSKEGCDSHYGKKHNCRWTGSLCVVGPST